MYMIYEEMENIKHHANNISSNSVILKIETLQEMMPHKMGTTIVNLKITGFHAIIALKSNKNIPNLINDT